MGKNEIVCHVLCSMFGACLYPPSACGIMAFKPSTDNVVCSARKDKLHWRDRTYTPASIMRIIPSWHKDKIAHCAVRAWTSTSNFARLILACTCSSGPGKVYRIALCCLLHHVFRMQELWNVFLSAGKAIRDKAPEVTDAHGKGRTAGGVFLHLLRRMWVECHCGSIRDNGLLVWPCVCICVYEPSEQIQGFPAPCRCLNDTWSMQTTGHKTMHLRKGWLCTHLTCWSATAAAISALHT